MNKKSIGILGLGVDIPETILANNDLEKMVSTSDEWIKTRSGIQNRHIIADDKNVSDMAAAAGLLAVKNAGLEVEDIDLVISASGSPEMIWPATACLAQTKMGMENIPAFDIQAACSSFSYGLTIAESLSANSDYRRILLISAETLSRFVDWSDRSTCVLFGDAAAAAVVGQVESGFGILASYLGADGSGGDMLKITVGGSGRPCGPAQAAVEQKITMNGREVFKFAVRAICESVEKVVERAALTISDIDYLIPHQANYRITESAAQRLGLQNKAISNIAEYGNTGAASIPLALAELRQNGKLRRGDIVVLVAFGAGLTWGANIIRWSETRCGKNGD